MTKTWQMSLMQSVMLSLLCEREREWKWVCTYKREREREREETCVLCSLFSTGRTDSVRKWEREYCVCVCGVLPSKNQSWRGSFLSVSDLERERDCMTTYNTVCGVVSVPHGGEMFDCKHLFHQPKVCLLFHHDPSPNFSSKGSSFGSSFCTNKLPFAFHIEIVWSYHRTRLPI